MNECMNSLQVKMSNKSTGWSNCIVMGILIGFGIILKRISKSHLNNRGAEKSLSRPQRKQATATEDFDVHISYLLS
jgi:hypothetical protein